VLGLRGVRYMLEATAGLPLRVYVQAPSSVPAVPGLETAGAEFGPEEIDEMLGWERVIGLAEVMDYVGVIQQSPRMQGILAAARRHCTVISGHSPEVRGADLAAYLVGGPLSDHEGRNPEELLEKLRLGMTIEGRVSSFSESMSVLGEIVRRLGQVPPNLVLCTDDIYPDDLLHQGHMDEVLRAGMRAGIPPVEAVRAATLNGALRHRLYDLGAIAPGKLADFVLADDLQDFQAGAVFVGGRLVAEAGSLSVPLPPFASEIERENTVHLGRVLTGQDFRLPAASKGPLERRRVLHIAPDLRRTLELREFPVVDGFIDFLAADDVCLAAIFERHGKGGSHALALVSGLGLHTGAAATTVAHDSHNLVVTGRDPQDMALAAASLAACGGGICSVSQGRLGALLPLPIAGLMSPAPLAEVAAQLEALNAALRAQGFTFAQPLTGLLSLALPVIPAYGLTDLGLVDIARQVLLADPPEEV
jgi:adenine deaminase